MGGGKRAVLLGFPQINNGRQKHKNIERDFDGGGSVVVVALKVMMMVPVVEKVRGR